MSTLKDVDKAAKSLESLANDLHTNTIPQLTAYVKNVSTASEKVCKRADKAIGDFSSSLDSLLTEVKTKVSAFSADEQIIADKLLVVLESFRSFLTENTKGLNETIRNLKKTASNAQEMSEVIKTQVIPLTVGTLKNIDAMTKVINGVVQGIRTTFTNFQNFIEDSPFQTLLVASSSIGTGYYVAKKTDSNLAGAAAGLVVGVVGYKLFKYFNYHSASKDLFYAAYNKDQIAARKALQGGATLEYKSDGWSTGGWTALHYAAYNGDLNMMKLIITSLESTVNGVILPILEINAVTNKPNNFFNFNNGFQTPLMLAAQSKNQALVDFLISKGADPNTKDSAGDTCASYYGPNLAYSVEENE